MQFCLSLVLCFHFFLYFLSSRDVIINYHHHQSSRIEWRRSIGVPDGIATSHLAHPELGELGCAIESERLTSYLMVMHDPQVMRGGPSRPGMGGRKMTLWRFGDDDHLPSIPEDEIQPATESKLAV